ncbi:hypothetical protein ACQ4LE_005174 [Meloidogyne hapla]
MNYENRGYLAHKDEQKNKVIEVIEAAIKHDIYVIVDFHYTGDKLYTEYAIEFFKEISSLYRNRWNMIYEIYNEPMDNNWQTLKKYYHEEIIPVIRGNDQNAVIICGTPNYDQHILDAFHSPIKKYKNIMYSLHFYASEGDVEKVRKNVQIALYNNFPLFVTEYGLTKGNGDGPINKEETKLWWEMLDKYGVSYINWAISNKPESSAALKPGSTKWDVGKITSLTESGWIVRNMLIYKHPKAPYGCPNWEETIKDFISKIFPLNDVINK